MKTQIFLTNPEKRALQAEFEVSNPTINKALGGFDKSAICRLIRKRALEMGGVERVITTTKTEEK